MTGELLACLTGHLTAFVSVISADVVGRGLRTSAGTTRTIMFVLGHDRRSPNGTAPLGTAGVTSPLRGIDIRPSLTIRHR